MACKKCPGSVIKRGAKSIMLLGSTYNKGKENGMLTLVLYKSPNRAMHNVYSPTRPRLDTGEVISGYGRRRGATDREIKMLEDGELTKEVANSIKAMGYSVFTVHKADAEAKPDLFVEIPSVKPAAKPVEDEDLTVVYGVTSAVERKLKADGHTTVASLKELSVDELASYMRDTKTGTAKEKAEQAKESLK